MAPNAMSLFLLLMCSVLHLSTSPTDLLDETAKALKKQIQNDRWKEFVKNREIVKELRDGHNIYRLTGDTVKKIPLKDIFYMLQNSDSVFPADHPRQHQRIEMNIGGENYQFRLAQAPQGEKQILVFDKAGKRPPTYDQHWEAFESSDVGTPIIAQAMVDASREPLGSQTSWVKTITDSKLRDHMRMLMVITQVAEAARPSDTTIAQLKDAMAAVKELNLQSEQVKLHVRKEWNKVFKRQRRNYQKSKWKGFEPLLDTVRKLALETDETTRGALKVQIAENLPPLSNKFYTELIKANAEELRNLVKELGHNNPTDNEYSKLREAVNDLKNARNMAAKNNFREHLPSLSEETISRFTETVRNRIWLERMKSLDKSGRVPGSEKVARRIFEMLADRDNKRTFSEVFREYFPIHITTKKGREEWFSLGLLLDSVSDDEPSDIKSSDLEDGGSDSKDDSAGRRSDLEDLNETRPRKRRRLDPVTVATADGDRSLVESELEDGFQSKRPCFRLRRRKRASSCSVDQLKLVDDSFEWKGQTLSFETIDEEGMKRSHSIEVNIEKMATPEHTREYVANLRESGILRATETVGEVVGYYGAVVNVLASAQYFSQGEYGKATFSAVQSAHILGGLGGVNNIIDQVSKRALSRVVIVSAEKVGLEKTLERASELGAKALGETGSKALKRIAGDIPFVGLVFDAYFITEDVKELQDKDSSLPDFLKYSHLVLDVSITVLTLIDMVVPNPIGIAASIALTVTRIAIDDFYIDISDELSKVKGKGFIEHVFAIDRGIKEGIFDVLTLKLNQQMKAYERQVKQNQELLRNLSDPTSFFNVTFQGLDRNGTVIGTVDFTAGILSQYGGFLTVKLHDNGSFTVVLPEVPTESGHPTRVARTFSFEHPVHDIVLGIGETAHPEYTHEQAKLWMFIPVSNYDVISRFEGHTSSRYGVYNGNAEDNSFYAVQGRRRRKRSTTSQPPKIHQQLKRETVEECQTPSTGSEITMLLTSYRYDLYGRGGNDKFFLGPQISQVTGGEDNDLYFIQPNGGRTIINNFAHDEEMDTLFLNVSYSSIVCHRDGWDLLVGYCQTHSIRMMNWFVHGNEEFHRHIYLATKDGVGIEVTETKITDTQHEVICSAVTIDKSNSNSSETLVLMGSYSEVKQVVGSNYSDNIVGNEKSNMLIGGLGDDHLKGGNGSDIYLIRNGDGIDTIDNFALDNKEDTLIVGLSYSKISVKRHESKPVDLIIFDSHNAAETQIKLRSWFEGPKWQHMIFISSDSVRFVVSEDDAGTPKKHPLTIDLSEYQYGVRLDLQNPNTSVNITVDNEVMDEVKDITDSPHNDTLIGNSLGNFMSCSGGSDFLQGNGGKDTYVIEKACQSVTIQNWDDSQDHDLMLLRFTSDQLHLTYPPAESFDLKIVVMSPQTVEIRLKDWFKSVQHQHLILRTTDKISAFLPENKTLNQGQILPFEIEEEVDCGGELRVIDLTAQYYSRVERFVAKTDACSYNVTGNSLNNYLDPGPDNPYGYQQLTGGNGTDTYVMGHKYGTYNTINNFARDEQVDYLQFDVVFHDIKVTRNGASTDVALTSSSRNDSVKVTILRYFEGKSFQHLVVQSVDGVSFTLQEEFPYVRVLMVDFSASPFSQTISALDNTSFSDVRTILGSKTAENHIQGGRITIKVMGGQMNDTIIGGPSGEDLIGMAGYDAIYGEDGNDAIYGGKGNDILVGGPGNDICYGGEGADNIDGGTGSDTVVFSGRNFTGVEINLQIGHGWKADAEGDTYKSIENVVGSAYDDILIGNEEDNIVRGSGGDDFIVPAGGYDIIQGGTGSDFYQLDRAFGSKVINNFATDETLDFIILNKILEDQICYFFLEDDLEVNINFIVNTSDAIARISLDEDFLHIKLAFWLKNTTYQHVAFILSDGIMMPEHFGQMERQLQPIVDQIFREDFIQITSSTENTINLRLNFSSVNLDSITPEYTGLEYVHLDHISASYYPLQLPPQQDIMNISLENLVSGVQHRFIVMLTSCNLTVSRSRLVFNTTKPSPPSDIVSSNVSFHGFKLLLIPPDSNTNPYASEYQYIVKIWSDEHAGESFEHITNSTVFSIHNLIPETAYKASVASRINGTNGHFTLPLTVTTSRQVCWNLQDLPSHAYIDDLERSEVGSIVVLIQCENGYNLEGNSKVVCNDSESVIPLCVPMPCTLPSISNSNRVQGTNNPVHGDEFEWTCHYGYEVSPSTTSFTSMCEEGEWTPALQSCQEKPKCPDLTAPVNGFVNATTVYVNESITFSCDTGYDLEGSELKHCLRSEANKAYWSPDDHGSEIPTCSLTQCSLPSISDANHEQGSDDPLHGDLFQWRCQHGFEVNEGLTVFSSTCHEGEWIPALQSCREKPKCPKLTAPVNGDISSPTAYVNETITFSCDSGYDLNGSELKRCLRFETNTAYWSPDDNGLQIPTCTLTTCSVPSISNANRVQGTNSPVHGDEFEWSCHYGYEVSQDVTSFTSTCQEGDWTPALQSCIEKPKCAELEAPDSGTISHTTAYVDETVTFTCDTGHNLEGSELKHCLRSETNTAYWSPEDNGSEIPTCTLTPCSVPSISNADLVQGTNNPVHGDEFEWTCHYGYEVSPRTTSFTSMCEEGEWTPALQSCQEKPKCPDLTAPVNGFVNAITTYVDESVTFSCDSGYDLEGPDQKYCRKSVSLSWRCFSARYYWSSFSWSHSSATYYWSPSDTVQCIPQECPALLPQPFGSYDSVGPHFTGDHVQLTCNSGYYVRNTLLLPDQVTLNCLGGHWDIEQKHCEVIIEIASITNYVLTAVGIVRYRPSTWYSRPIDSSLYGMICKLMVHRNIKAVKLVYTIWGTQYRCIRSLQLTQGPNQYEGILSDGISDGTSDGNPYICVKDMNTANNICNALGYGRYTVSVYQSAGVISTKRTSSNGVIVSQQESCYHRISCRKSCDYPNLNNGYPSCPYGTLEGNTCYFYCNAGYALIGSSSRECTSSGWTGTQPFCDGEQWKRDVERLGRDHSSSSHGDLAVLIREYLWNKYSDVLWAVIVYDELSGWEAHTVRGEFYNLWRHYGHNIVVSRVVSPRGSYAPSNLESTFWDAYEAVTYRRTSWWRTTTHFHARDTVNRVWCNLQNEGLSPIMLHIFRRASYGFASYCDGRCKHFTLPNRYGYATVIAEDL